MYDAYGDRWPALAGVWETEEEAQRQIAGLGSIPRSYEQPRPNRSEGHITSFEEYEFRMDEVTVGEAVEEFDPMPLLKELERRTSKRT
jgi:hypothetical protein